jgi:hypothetical protein
MEQHDLPSREKKRAFVSTTILEKYMKNYAYDSSSDRDFGKRRR